MHAYGRGGEGKKKKNGATWVYNRVATVDGVFALRESVW